MGGVLDSPLGLVCLPLWSGLVRSEICLVFIHLNVMYLHT